MSRFGEQLKELFKTKAQKQEDDEKKLKSALENEHVLVEKLKTLADSVNDKKGSAKVDDAEVEALFPKTLGLQKKTANAPTDEELYATAKNAIAPKYAKSRQTLTDNYQTELAKKETAKSKTEDSYGEEYVSLVNAYDALKESVKNDSIKRGTSRSSILLERLKKAENEHSGEERKLAQSYQKALTTVENEISQLTSSQQAALKNLQLDEAQTLRSKLNTLITERDKLVESVNAFNAEVDRKESEYQVKRAKEVAATKASLAKSKLSEQSAVSDYEKEFGYSEEKQKNYAERYELAHEYYFSLSPSIAASALEASPNMRYYLGTYYSKLLSALKERYTDKNSNKYYF